VNELLTLFTTASKLLRQEADQRMSAHGVRVGQNIVLEALWAADNLTPGQIATRIGVSTPTVVNTAHRMELAGLVTREPDPEDARLVRICLTDSGRAVRRKIEAVRDDLAEHATASLTGPEQRHLRSALRKVINQLEPD
jgi:MarR family transcriptional regulator, organic hydroperoxide resistance regulator